MTAPDPAPVMRIGDRERRATDDRLRAALDDGVLTVLEYDERTQQCWASRTQRELDALVADLPAATSPASEAPTIVAPSASRPEAGRPWHQRLGRAIVRQPHRRRAGGRRPGGGRRAMDVDASGAFGSVDVVTASEASRGGIDRDDDDG